MAKKLLWTTEKRKVSDLKDHPNNPRTLSKKSHADLLMSFNEFDYVELVAVDADNTIVAGHQRIHIMLELGWDNKEIEVRVPNRKLSDKEQRKYLLLSNKVKGDWDWDILGDQWEEEELFEGGFTREEIYGKEIEEIQEPDNLTDEVNSKAPSMKITFASVDHLQEAENKISEIVSRYTGAYYSISAGEL